MAIPPRALPSLNTSGTTGVILAIDYGKKRFGLALSDELGITARPYATWARVNRRRDLARLHELVRQESVRRIIVGLPLHLDGTPSAMSEEAKSFSLRLEKAIGIPVQMVDERLSSWEAKQSVTKMKSHKRRAVSSDAPRARKTPLDDVAASIILRDYLDRVRPQAGLRD